MIQRILIRVLMAFDRFMQKHVRRPPKTTLESRFRYPQTWWWVTHLPRPVRVVAQWLCGKLIGHELSDTEHGYGGGKYVDRWCRWCNKLIQIPIEESVWAQENQGLCDAVGESAEEDS